MAIKRIPETTPKQDKIYGTIIADTKVEVTNNLVFDDGYSMDFGSVAVTTEGDVAILKSDGKWGWL